MGKRRKIDVTIWSQTSTIQQISKLEHFWYQQKLVAKASIWLVPIEWFYWTHHGIHRMIVRFVFTSAKCFILDFLIYPKFSNLSKIEQNIFRVFRLGQKRICCIYRLLAMGTMEEKVYSRSVTKQAMSFRVVDEQQIDRHYSMAELQELYTWVKTHLR